MKTDTIITPPSEVSRAATAAVGPPVQTEGGTLQLSSKVEDLRGKQYGRLTVLTFAGVAHNRNATWNCRCSCGAILVVRAAHLKCGYVKSCGCLYRDTRGTYPDLTNYKFGRLKIIERTRDAKWRCRCDCGNITFVRTNSLRSGNTLSCGCLRNDRLHAQNIKRKTCLVGQTFGRLTVVKEAEPGRKNLTMWRCRCRCGATVTVPAYKLKSGHTRSCGCLADYLSSQRYGLKNPNWNQELTQEDRDRYRGGTPTNRAWQTVSQKVRRRDRATCLACGEHGTHVHHLQPWAACRDLRYDPANLVTLCKECHMQFHELYGNDAELDDLEEYLKP